MGPSALPAVISVDVNPLDNTHILVAYANSVVVLFDINARKGAKFFVAPPDVCPLPLLLFLFLLASFQHLILFLRSHV